MTRALIGGGLVLLFVFLLIGRAGAAVCVEPPAGLVSWWPGDGNADDLAGGNDGTLMGGVVFATGKVGQAFLLDGVDAYVNAGDSPSLQVSGGDFTIEAWVWFNSLTHPPGENRDAAPGNVSILDKMSTRGVNADGWRLLKQEDHRFWFCLGGNIGNQCARPAFTLFSTTVAQTGVWYHLAVVKSAIAFSLYVDGQLQDSRSPIPDFMDLHVGDLRIGSNALQGTHLNGLIDEVAIYSRALSATEIQAIVLAGDRGKCKATTVLIDLKPGIFPNSLNPMSKGKIPVAILTTDAFDATTVDPATVRFGRTGAEARVSHSALEDVNGDGKPDIMLHFETQETGIVCGDTSVTLTGQTIGSQTIQGSDSIRTVGCT